jgi:ribosomal protein L11 methyltransferase
MATKQKPWTRLTVRVPTAVADALGTRCIELGAPGVVTDERDLRRDATTDGQVRRRARPSPGRFTAYFPPKLDPRRIAAELHAFLDDLARELPEARRRSLKFEPYEPQSWASTWRQHFPPVRVGRRLLIAPSWTKARELRTAAEGRIVLRVDPARAFGTGHHPTTRGCLVALERVVAGAAPKRGLDVGCGTGVLAVAMRALGVAEVVGVDTDPVACTSTLACAAANGVDAVRVLPSLGRVRGRFDVVIANLFAGLLVAMAPQLAARTAVGGHLIVAGLLASQENDVQRALERAGFRVLRRECRATWSVLTLLRESGGRAGRTAPAPRPTRTGRASDAAPRANARRRPGPRARARRRRRRGARAS